MGPSEGQADLSILFVADGDRLEMQSWLLAGSLARAHEGGPAPHLYAYVTPGRMANVSPLTRDLYDACGVELRPLPPPPDWRAPYPHGNKMVAASDRRETSRAVFLDTDMVVLRPLLEMAQLPPDTVAAAPEGVPTWGADDDRWERAYAHFGLPMPEERVRLLRGRGREFVPYYNAGFVAFPDRAATGETRFADRWIETALAVDHDCPVGGKRPWLDQISLPLALARFGYRTEVLTHSWNYALTRRKDYSATPDAHVLHYHRYRFLVKAPQWPALIEDFWDRLPARHHAAAQAAFRDAELLS
ncbi:hypothetical protein N8I71_01040 [Roseibacterium sp. SDUM158016]|uniref:hypothetical protein n=1 Tax=Roseicyclus sediminis TaxID=2980997 RepID=UPI0021D3E8A6|nr:hypothetical protein [Roseibacterium sp. SDUM158016]MCU4651402.1 hypothetical protein [Roseibacterium sp. SDUM158016]